MAINLIAHLRLRDHASETLRRFSDQTRRARDMTDQASRSLGNYRDTQGRLRNSMGQTARQQENVNRAMGGTVSMAGSLTSKLVGVATVIAGVAAAAKIMGESLKGAMNLEQNQISMEHFIGLTDPKGAAKKTQEYLNYLRENANLTPFDTDEVINAGRRAVNISGGDISQAKNLLTIAEDMAALNPGKTLSDAIEALADLKVGETERMKEFGFKISQDDIKAAGGAMKIINGDVAKMFAGGAAKLSNSGAGLLSTITGTFSSGITDMGVKTLDLLKPQMQKVADWMNNGGLDKVFTVGSNAMAGFASAVIDVVSVVSSNWSKVTGYFKVAASIYKPLFNTIVTAVKGVSETIAANMPRVSEMIKQNVHKVKPVVGMLSSAFSLVADAVKSALPTVLDVSTTVIPIVLNLVSKLATGITWLIENVVRPLVPVLGTSFIQTWGYLKPVLGAIDLAIDKVSDAIGTMVNSWASVKTSASQLWQGVTNTFKSGINVIIGHLNTLIDAMNRAFNVQLPDWMGGQSFKLDIPRIEMLAMDYSANQEAMQNFRDKKALGIEGSFASGIDYVPRDMNARIHEGERVMTKQENREYSRSGGGTVISGNTFVVNAAGGDVSDPKVIDRIALSLAQQMGALN